jgi:ferredoxin
MKITVTEGCAGHGRCYVLAPQIFRDNEDGYNADAGSVIDVDDSLREAADIAALNCPERAIEVHDE